ncbi:MAG: hypothetical protein JWQ98_2102 [Chlorobi bacterium]|jgi:hypothetical protein|nr:hypothetical protein [Chlorobiota bacterium]
MNPEHSISRDELTWYDPGLSLRDARELYFQRYGFNNGGYDDAWVRLQAGPIPIFFPNIPARVIAVKYHDLHHVLTEYPATWVGEAEIGAWEIASGCRGHWPAWILNLYAFAIGLMLAPGRTYRAFARGRISSNLYAMPFNDALLSQTIGSMRRKLGLGLSLRHPGMGDLLGFLLWGVIAVTLVMLPPIAALLGLALVIARLL